MRSRVGSARSLGPGASVALAALLAALLLAAPAQAAPGDIADLAITKTDSPDPVAVGAALTYSIAVTNQGPQGAGGVTVVDRLPRHVSFVSATASSGTCARKGRRVTCSLGNLAAAPAPGSSATVLIQVVPTKAGRIVNTASVSSVETGPVAINDRASTTTTVVEPKPVTCRGVPATLVGTAGPDQLVGTQGRDVIAGLGGDDVIFGRGGDDLICAGAGDDWVNGGPGADRVLGGAGNDRLVGRAGPDVLIGNRGHDVLKGNIGNDRLLGHSGNDRLWGHAGNDRLFGNAGNDQLRGGRGFDRCGGGPGRDFLRGCQR